jgi:hypothetical protein
MRKNKVGQKREGKEENELAFSHIRGEGGREVE